MKKMSLIMILLFLGTVIFLFFSFTSLKNCKITIKYAYAGSIEQSPQPASPSPASGCQSSQPSSQPSSKPAKGCSPTCPTSPSPSPGGNPPKETNPPENNPPIIAGEKQPYYLTPTPNNPKKILKK